MAPMRPTPAVVVTPITPTKPKSVPSGPASTPDLQSSFVEQDPFNSLSPSPSNNNLFAPRKRRSHLQALNQEGEGGDTDNLAQKMGNREDGDDTSEMLRWGWIMLVGSTISFIVGVWSIAVGPFLDTKGFLVLDTMSKDTHYKYLLVFLVPVTLYAVIINWWGLKIFRHA